MATLDPDGSKGIFKGCSQLNRTGVATKPQPRRYIPRLVTHYGQYDYVDVFGVNSGYVTGPKKTKQSNQSLWDDGVQQTINFTGQNTNPNPNRNPLPFTIYPKP